MNRVVVDASVAASWLLQDEHDPAAEDVLAALEEAPGLVPTLWHYEMRNVFLAARRRNRLSAGDIEARLMALADLPLETDPAPDLDTAMTLAEKNGLSFYDGLYLELACRMSARLATLDARCSATARLAGAEGRAF